MMRLLVHSSHFGHEAPRVYHFPVPPSIPAGRDISSITAGEEPWLRDITCLCVHMVRSVAWKPSGGDQEGPGGCCRSRGEGSLWGGEGHHLEEAAERPGEVETERASPGGRPPVPSVPRVSVEAVAEPSRQCLGSGRGERSWKTFEFQHQALPREDFGE